MEGTQSGVLSVQGLELYYEESGKGLPLLLLHAGIADSRMWAEQVKPLAQHFRVIVCDLPGYGRTQLPNGRFSYHEVIHQLTDALALDSLWLIGASFGGQVAVDFTLAYPKKVRGLVLIAPLVSGYEPSSQIRQFNEEEERLLEAGLLEEATELNMRLWVDGPGQSSERVSPALRLSVAEMQLRAFSVDVPERAALNRLDPPAIGRLAEINVPTLILIGTLDLAEVIEHANYIEQQVANSTRVVLADVAHMLSMERPGQFSEAVLQFVDEHESKGQPN